MLLRRITCATCGAVAEKENVDYFVYCDYCGNLVDIDFGALSRIDPAGATEYATYVAQNAQRKQAALAAGDRETYRQIERGEWERYIDLQPLVHPKGVDKAGERRETYLQWCAESAAERAFNNSVSTAYAQAAQVVMQEGWPPPQERFLAAIEAYRHADEVARKAYAEKGIEALFPDQIPEAVSTRMLVSSLLQGWRQFMEQETVGRIIREYGLGGLYIMTPDAPQESAPPPELTCRSCRARLTVPPGVSEVECEFCGTTLQLSEFESG